MQTRSGEKTYESTEDQGVRLALKIISCLRIGEGLVGNSLLQTVEVLNIASALGSGGVAEKRKDGSLNLVDIVQVQGGLDASEEPFMRVLLFSRC